jgi:hypothetical protein
MDDTAARALRLVCSAGGTRCRALSSEHVIISLETAFARAQGFRLIQSVPHALVVFGSHIAAFVGNWFDKDLARFISSLYVLYRPEFQQKERGSRVFQPAWEYPCVPYGSGHAAHLMCLRHHFKDCIDLIRNTTRLMPGNNAWLGYWRAGAECRRHLAVLSWQSRPSKVRTKKQRPYHDSHRLAKNDVHRAMLCVWPMFHTYTEKIVQHTAENRSITEGVYLQQVGRMEATRHPERGRRRRIGSTAVI